MKIIVVFFVAMICIGCSTSPVKYSDAVEVPESRRFDAYAKYAAPNRESANVIIVRDSGFTGSAVAVPIYVNGERVAQIYVSESISLKLESGEQFIGVTQGGHISEKAEKRNLDEQILLVKDGEKYYFRVGVLTAKGLILQRSSQIN